jgi:hypothetical protein
MKGYNTGIGQISLFISKNFFRCHGTKYDLFVSKSGYNLNETYYTSLI